MDGPPAERRYGLVIFDNDGTLADTFPWFLSVLDGVADRYRFRRADPAERERLRSLGPREILAELAVPRWRLPFIVRHVRRLKADEIGSFRLFPGVPETLRRLSEAGVRLAIVSSDTEANVRAILGPDLSRLIGTFDCGASLFGKRRHIARVVRRAGASPRSVLYIGDEIRDAEAARAVGTAFGAATWGYSDGDALRRAGPDAVFGHPREIAEHCLPRAGVPASSAILTERRPV